MYKVQHQIDATRNTKGNIMGMNKASITALMLEGKQRPFAGRALTFGRQSIYVTSRKTFQIAKEVGYTLSHASDPDIQSQAETARSVGNVGQLGNEVYESPTYRRVYAKIKKYPYVFKWIRQFYRFYVSVIKPMPFRKKAPLPVIRKC